MFENLGHQIDGSGAYMDRKINVRNPCRFRGMHYV